MRTRDFDIMCRAVEEGVNYGHRRAHKHVEHPDEDDLKQYIMDAVVNAMCEVFAFDDLVDDPKSPPDEDDEDDEDDE